MNKKKEKEIVKIAEGEVKKFGKEWRENPYLWESETDIHAELYMRIKASLYKKFPPRKYKYKGMTKKEKFDWVYCKPKTYINGANYPDLVIYKDNDKKNDAGDRENDPMLWACEIKYATEWSSDVTDSMIKKDGNKLTKLLNQKGGETEGADYACLLVFFRWMKQYASKTICKKGEKDICRRANKINVILNNFKNKRFNAHFYRIGI